MSSIMPPFGFRLNISHPADLPLSLGIGAGHDIHLVAPARGMQIGTDGGLSRTSTTRARFFSAVTTVVSFGNLMFSYHRGGIASMGVLLTLPAILLVWPALLLRVAGVSQREPC